MGSSKFSIPFTYRAELGFDGYVDSALFSTELADAWFGPLPEIIAPEKLLVDGSVNPQSILEDTSQGISAYLPEASAILDYQLFYPPWHTFPGHLYLSRTHIDTELGLSEAYYQRMHAAQRLEIYYQRGFESSVRACLEALPVDQVGTATRMRPKSFGSLLSKLEELASISPTIPDALGNLSMLSDFSEQVSDGIGITIQLHTGSKAGAGKMVDALCAAVRAGKIEIIKISNHRGVDIPGYVNEDMMQKISDVCKAVAGNPCARESPDKEIRDNGYTTFQVNVRFPNGLLGDIHIRGSMVEWVARADHIVYLIRKNRPPSVLDTAKFHSFTAEVLSMTDDQKQAYNEYLAAWYCYARLTEAGDRSATIPPQKPDILKHELFDVQELYTYKLMYGLDSPLVKASSPEDATIRDADVHDMGNVVRLLEQNYKERLAASVASCAAIWPAGIVGVINKIRAKKSRSIVNKLKKYRITNADFEVLFSSIPDGVGLSLQLHTGSPRSVENFVEHLCQAIRDKKLTLVEIDNARGALTPGYLDQGLLEKIMQACNTYQVAPCRREERSAEIRKNGLTLLKLCVIFPDGTPGEIQVKGSMVHWLWQVEHILYKMREGAELDIDTNDHEFKIFMRLVQAMTAEEKKRYNDYLNSMFMYARLTEMGHEPDPPKVPEEFLEKHSYFDLHNLYTYYVLHQKK